MDNQNARMPEEGSGDKKADKKAAKQAKREEKARKREEKLRQKLAKAGASPEEIEKAVANSGDYDEEGGSRIFCNPRDCRYLAGNLSAAD